MTPTLSTAASLVRSGISIIPIRLDGTKSPSIRTWKDYQERLPTEAELQRMFAKPAGIAAIGGDVSGGLEIIDFDDGSTFDQWAQLIQEELPDVLPLLSIAKTPRIPCGYHVRYRCPGHVEGNQKLAMAADGKTCRIETRGRGGYVVVEGSPAEVHQNRMPYCHFAGPPLSDVREVSPEAREVLIRTARLFDESPKKPPKRPINGHAGDNRPGDAFGKATPWEEILEPHGWRMVRDLGSKKIWCRPEKEKGISATTGHCSSNGHDLLAVFSSNAHPFEGPSVGKVCSCHSKFDAYAKLNHGGDHSAAASALRKLGFGAQRDGHTNGKHAGTAKANNGTEKQLAGPDDRLEGDGATPDTGIERILLTDVGNGKRFAAEHGSIARFCHPWSKWLLWDGTRWRIDDTGRAMALAKQTILGLFRWAAKQIESLAGDESDEAKSKAAAIRKVLNHALKSQHVNRLKAMLDLAKSEPGIPILPDVLDADPWALNLANGTLDLKTGLLRPHSQPDYLTKICPVAFDPSATCHRWENFLAEIFDYCESLMGYMQRLSGYWLTGQTTEHALPVFYGTGANGKSTYVGAIFDLLGADYSGKASRDLLTAIKGDKHPTSLAWLHGKRFVAAIETAEGARLDEALVKELTGGDAVTARRMREDFWTFQPTHKIALVTNHKPTIKGTDHAIWRRLRLIPFTIAFTEDKQDKNLLAKLRAELPGILNWALAGCLGWQKHGLADPAEVVAATAEYRNAEDRIGEFLLERCHLNPGFRVKVTDLYAAFRHWADTHGERELSGTAFGKALGERGFERDAGKRWYLGLDLLPYEDA
jgi:putative DNA primase/helicase